MDTNEEISNTNNNTTQIEPISTDNMDSIQPPKKSIIKNVSARSNNSVSFKESENSNENRVTLEVPNIALTPRNPTSKTPAKKSLSFKQQNIPTIQISASNSQRSESYSERVQKSHKIHLDARRPKRKHQKFIRQKSVKNTFAPKMPSYVSLWPRSELIACYFQFIGLIASCLALEYVHYIVQTGVLDGLNNISIAGDKLTRTMLILQVVVFGIGTFIRLGWPSKREEITAAAMGLIMSVVCLIVNGLNDKSSGRFLVVGLVVSLVCGILSIVL